jgi:hypothetical protein
LVASGLHSERLKILLFRL